MDNILNQAAYTLQKIRNDKPLIHNITNYVVMNFTANTLLAIGASPVMAHAINEVEQMVSLSASLVINIGTLSNDWVDSMILAGKRALKRGIPTILDPVGSGATYLRTMSAKRIIAETSPSVIRGNASEIISLYDSVSLTKGVDSTHNVDDAVNGAKKMATDLSCTVAITGPEDFITDGTSLIKVKNGHPLITSITGTGCAATATIGAFLASDPCPFTATASALAFFGLASEKAAEKTQAPGSFMVHFLDALYTITPEELEQGAIIEEVS